MSLGIDITARQRANIVLESVPGTYDPAGPAWLAQDFRGDFQEKIDRGKHRNEGENLKAYVHNKKRWVELSGDFDPDFRQFEKWMKMGFQITNDDVITTGPNIGGRRIVAILPNEGGIDRKTATIEWGKKASATRSQLGLLTSLTVKNDAKGECMGTVALKARKPSLRGVPMTGGVAQNEKYALAGNGGSGGLTLAYTLPGSATPRSVTLLSTDSALQIKAKFEAFADGVSVNVVGTLGAISEVQTLVTGAGYTGVPVVVSVTRQDGTTAQFTITPGDSLAIIGTNASTALGVAGSVTATGTSTAGTGATTAVGDPNAGGGNADYYTGLGVGVAWTGATGSYALRISLTNANGETLPTISQNIALTNASTTNTKLGALSSSAYVANAGSPPSGATGYNVYLETAPGSGVLRRVATVNGTTATASYTTAPPIGSAPLPTTNTTASGGTPGALNLQLTIAGALAGYNIAQFTSATAGVTLTTPTQGAVTGVPTVEFASPANTRVFASKTAGDALITLTEIQAGSSGVLVKTKPAPLGPRMWRAWRTDVLPDVAFDPDVAYKLGTLLDHEISYADMVAEVDFEDDDDSFQSWRDGVDAQEGLKVTAKCTLATASGGAVTAMIAEANSPVDANGDADNVTGAKWYRLRAQRSKFRLAFDLFACVQDSTSYKDASGVYAVEFPLGILSNDAAGFGARIVLEMPPTA